jgi:hypothetical protein
MREFNFLLVPHSPFSPDLGPSDFYFAGTIERRLGGEAFKTLAKLRERSVM